MIKENLTQWPSEGNVGGCDEAGRGCLAGPVVAAAVILPPNYNCPGLTDSKKLTAKKRQMLRSQIEADAVAYSVQSCSPSEIDDINILNASFLAMHRCIEQLNPQPDLLLIDGNRFKPYPNIPHHCIIKGDAKYLSIAAASILAKTYRDELMEELDALYPEYAWKKNMGYPTSVHRQRIAEWGPTRFHRMSFTLLPNGLATPKMRD